MLFEVISKHIPALDDLRKGVAFVKVSQTTLLDLLERLPDVQKRVFPPQSGKIDVTDAQVTSEVERNYCSCKPNRSTAFTPIHR